MSRSRKKTKIRGITTSTTEKKEKQDANRKFRRTINQKVKSGEGHLPLLKELSNVWSFSKDGKFFDSEMEDKYLRK
ncbi:hypothetical protein [Chondrinema litorale]|uniref:hypothetical protein n=1 Tax=Chondrinema litorale TaxID=2994555 RepID=UPI0025432CB4|nr:hypothetical protein [Chondrinema litorale]UZR98090.1 hypothetical protein OQ292_30150 [Chondrinema litorale]